ncbi:MAG: carbon starvation CstA family protein [Planctomycetota bacterium]|jgi:carbon starvation protein
MNALAIVLASAAALYLGFRFYGRFVTRRVYGAGDLPDERVPSRAREDGIDFVPTRRSVLFGHHYVTIAGAGPIVGPAVAVTWGWLPALLWVVLGAIFIGAVHDVGALIASVRNRGRTIGDLAADIMTPRVRLLFLSFIAMALWVVLAVFGFVIAGLFANVPASVFAVWIEVPLALLVGYMVYRRGGSMLFWSLLALVAMYVSIGIGMAPPVQGLFEGVGVVPWLVVLFGYVYLASVLPVTKLLQPRDYINSHQLFLALGLLAVGFVAAPFTDRSTLEVVAPAVNQGLPKETPLLYPFLFITVACGAISGFHCMVASGTTARQLSSERDAHAIGYGAMILEGALAVIVIVCCISAAGFSEAEWTEHYSTAWVGGKGLIGRIQGFVHGGAGFIAQGCALFGLAGAQLNLFLQTVIAVVIISFAATTMDSATRIQRYVISELGSAVGTRRFESKHLATALAVFSAAALAILVRAEGKGWGSGGMVLWPIFGVTNQLLACLTFLILNTWLAKRGKPLIYTLLPMLFLIVTVSWAGAGELVRHLRDGQWHLVLVLGIGLALEAWMIYEGFAALKLSRRVRGQLAAQALSREAAQLALAGPSGTIIGEDGVIRNPGDRLDLPDGSVC